MPTVALSQYPNDLFYTSSAFLHDDLPFLSDIHLIYNGLVLWGPTTDTEFWGNINTVMGYPFQWMHLDRMFMWIPTTRYFGGGFLIEIIIALFWEILTYLVLFVVFRIVWSVLSAGYRR
ncbi:MAG: hypothetical protein ABI254_08875, partial [Chthoniobacterales bacterium]